MMPSTLRLKQKNVIGQSNDKAQNEISPQGVINSNNDLHSKKQSLANDQMEGVKKPEPKTLRPKNTQFPFEGENDLDREIERNVAQGTSRMGEAVLGAPGDILSMIKGFVGDLPIGGLIGEHLPTSGKLREVSEKATGGYTKPKSEFEEKGGEILQDIASMALPGAGQYSFLRNIGIPLAGAAAKEFAGDSAKMGLMVGLDLIAHRQGGAKKFAGNLFNESEKLIPEGAALKSSKFQSSINNLEKTLESGGTAPSTEKALKKVGELQEKMKSGQIEIKELIDFRKKINEIKESLGGYDPQMPTKIRKKAIANLDKVKDEVISGLNEYGTKTNPKFLELNKAANEAWGAYESSNKVADFIGKTMKNSIKNPGLKTILGLGGGGYGLITHGAAAGKLAAVGALPAAAGYEGYKILHQVLKSPTLRKYYGEVLKGAASGNAAQVSRNVKALDQAMDKEKIDHQVSG